MIDVISDAALFSRSSFQCCVRRDARYKVLAQIRREVGEASVTKDLCRTQDRRGIDVVAFGHLSGREETSLVGRVEDRPHQTLATRVEFGSCIGESRVKSCRRSFAIAAIRT